MKEIYLTEAQLLNGSLSSDELEELVKLFKIVWPARKFTKSYLEWLYKKNPNGTAYTCNITNNGRILAHYAAIPIRAKLFGNNEVGLLSVNSVVDPDCRGKGYFKLLAKNVYANAKEHGCTFVIGVANANSTLLFQKLLRFQHVGQLSVKIGIGDIATINNSSPVPDFKSIWDCNSLSWRLSSPNAKYQLIKNSFGSFSMLMGTGKFGVQALVKNINVDCKNIKFNRYFRWNPINIWIGYDPSCDWKRSLYANFPEFLKPSPLNLVFKDLTEGNRRISAENMVFTLLDFDAF